MPYAPSTDDKITAAVQLVNTHYSFVDYGDYIDGQPKNPTFLGKSSDTRKAIATAITSLGVRVNGISPECELRIDGAENIALLKTAGIDIRESQQSRIKDSGKRGGIAR